MDVTHGTHNLNLSFSLTPTTTLTHVCAQPTTDTSIQPFVDEDHALHSFFPPRVWAIRIPVILILLGSTVVGSFLAVVMIRSNRKKAAKAKAKAQEAQQKAAGKKKA